MKPDKHLLLLFAALILSAVSQHFYASQYRREMRIDQTASRELAQKQAGAYLQQNLEEAAPLHEEHEDDHSEGHVSSAGQEHEHEHPASEATKTVKSVALDVSDVPGNQLDIGKKATASTPFSLCTDPNCKSHGHEHMQTEHADHDHESGHDAHEHAHGTSQDPSVTPGFALLLRELGFAELAANLLWLQMDSDSHRGLWHRVEVALELIPALDPTFIDAYLLRSFLLDEYMKKHDEALQILENAVKQVPNRIELWQQIGIFCLNHSGRHGPKRRLDRALEAFNMMFRFYDPPPQTTRLIAVTLAAMERREEAIAVLQKSADAADRPPDQLQIDREMIGRIRSGEKF